MKQTREGWVVALQRQLDDALILGVGRTYGVMWRSWRAQRIWCLPPGVRPKGAPEARRIGFEIDYGEQKDYVLCLDDFPPYLVSGWVTSGVFGDRNWLTESEFNRVMFELGGVWKVETDPVEFVAECVALEASA